MNHIHAIIDLEFHPVSAYAYPTAHSISPNEIIQLGMVVLDESMKQIVTYSTYVKPSLIEIEKLNKKISKLTGITTSDLEDAPSLADVLSEIEHLLENYDNVRFYTWSDSDLTQIRREAALKAIAIPSVMNRRKWIDLQKIYTRLLKYTHNLSLREAALFTDFDFDSNAAHAALYDAIVTADLLKLVKRKEQFAIRTKNVRRSFDPSIGKTTLGDIFAQKLGMTFA